MKTTIALPISGDSVAPLFESASTLRVISIDGNAIVSQHDVSMASPLIAVRAVRLASLCVDTLICNAISAHQAILLRTVGISVVRWATGPVADAVQAWIDGTLQTELAPHATALRPAGTAVMM